MMFAKTLAFAFSFALPVLLVRRLDQKEFGLYKQVFLFVGTAFSLLPLGVGMSAFYFLPREPERRHQVVFNILLFHLLISIVACLTLLARPTLLASLFNGAEMAAYAPLVGLVVFTWVASSSLEMIAVANNEMKLATLFVITSQFTKSFFLLAAAIFFGTVESLLYAALIQGVLQTALLLFYLNARFKGFWRGFQWEMLKVQLAYALPLGFASMLYRAQTELDNYFVSHKFGAGVYAIYAVGCFELPLLGVLSDAVSSVTIPRISYLQKHGERREIAELIARMMRKLSALLLPLYFFLLIAGREFLTTLFTAQYLPSWPIFVINLTLIPLTLITSAYDPVIRAFAEHRYFLLKLRGVLLVVFVTGLWLVLGRYGLIGAITVMVTVNVIDRLVIARKVKNILGVTRRDLFLLKDVGKIALASITGAAVAFIARSFVIGMKPLLMLIVCGIAFSIAYLLAVLLLGIVSQEERGAITRQLARVGRLTSLRRAADPLA